MHIEQVIHQMVDMRLSTMADSLRTRLDNGEQKGLAPEQFVALLIEDEYVARKSRKLNRLIGKANFKPEQACIENVNYSQSRGIQKSDVMQLTTRKWIEEAENIIITGSTGSGKTYLAEALGFYACKMGYPVQKIRYRMLFEEIKAARGTGLYLKYLKKLSTIRVLIIDDFLMQNIDLQEAGFLVDIIDEKQQLGSVIVTTQYPISKWHHQIPDPSIADAICDRLAHTKRIFNLKGAESMRKKTYKSGLK